MCVKSENEIEIFGERDSYRDGSNLKSRNIIVRRILLFVSFDDKTMTIVYFKILARRRRCCRCRRGIEELKLKVV